jgi:hypothetical protein
MGAESSRIAFGRAMNPECALVMSDSVAQIRRADVDLGSRRGVLQRVHCGRTSNDPCAEPPSSKQVSRLALIGSDRS